MNLAKYLLTLASQPQVWALDPRYIRAFQEAYAAYLETGVAFNLSDIDFPDQKMTSEIFAVSTWDNGRKLTAGDVNVQRIHGVMTKDTGPCGEPGTLDIAAALQHADSQKNIVAHVLDINSPGGEAAGVDTLHQTIRSLSKPVVSFVNELAASAGYYAAAGGQQIILSGRAAQVGSIGVVLEYLDNTRMLEKRGLDVVSITATQSREKRDLNFSQPTEADKQLIRERMLDPMAAFFHEAVQASRPAVSESALTGRVFYGPDAINQGLADSYGTLNTAINTAYQLSQQ